MSELVHRPVQPVSTEVFGSRRRWVLDAAVVGAIATPLGAYSGIAFVSGAAYVPTAWLVGCALGGLGVGLVLGIVAPRLLETARGRVPLPLMAVGVPVVTAAIGTSLALFAAAAVGAPLFPACLFATVLGCFLGGMFWLPYTVASAMQMPRWPVVIAALMAAPMTGPLAVLVGTLLV